MGNEGNRNRQIFQNDTVRSEEARVRQIIENMARGDDAGDKLVYDRVTKTFRPSSSLRDPDRATEITPEDADLFGT